MIVAMLGMLMMQMRIHKVVAMFAMRHGFMPTT